jgi:hypothetical protein
MAVRNFGDQPFPARASSAQSGHVGRSAGLVDEDEFRRVKARLRFFPARAGRAYVLALLLGGVQAFF